MNPTCLRPRPRPRAWPGAGLLPSGATCSVYYIPRGVTTSQNFTVYLPNFVQGIHNGNSYDIILTLITLFFVWTMNLTFFKVITELPKCHKLGSFTEKAEAQNNKP